MQLPAMLRVIAGLAAVAGLCLLGLSAWQIIVGLLDSVPWNSKLWLTAAAVGLVLALVGGTIAKLSSPGEADPQ